MSDGETDRVARVLRAAIVLEDLRDSSPRRPVLEARIAAVVAQLTPEETTAYYATLRARRWTAV